MGSSALQLVTCGGAFDSQTGHCRPTSLSVRHVAGGTNSERLDVGVGRTSSGEALARFRRLTDPIVGIGDPLLVLRDEKSLKLTHLLLDQFP